MLIIGCDFHTRYQQIAMLDEATGGTADNGNVTAITNNRDNTRSQNFTYDALNRLATAQTQTAGVTIPNSNCWGLTVGYDPWGNLLSSIITGPAGCAEPLALNVLASSKNQMTTTADQQTGYCYDAAGNLLLQATCPTSNPVYAYTYNAENQLTATAGLTYTYDGDGKRVKKSNGTLYWYGGGSDALDETDAYGSTTNSAFNEYVFFGGKRIARRTSSNTFYYFADHLGTSRVIVQAGQTSPCYDADFYPFGGERIVTDTCDSAYKFTGKERDSESGLDHFQFRNYGSSMGRWLSPDPINLTAKRLINPANTLNKYVYGGNNPLVYVDPTGQDITVFYRAPSGDGGYGHILLAVTNQAKGAVRFADYYPKGGDKNTLKKVPGEMNQGVTSDRLKNHAALTIQTTPDVAQKLIDAIDTMNKQTPGYWLLTSTCATACADLLNLAGIDVSSTLVTPTDVWSLLYADYSSEALEGGQLKMGFYRYQAGRDFGSPMSVFPKGTDPSYNLQLLYWYADLQRNLRQGCKESWDPATNTLHSCT